MSDIKVVQIVGWPRSGTNYLQWLLRKNFRDLIVIPGYKHSSNSAPYMACLEGAIPIDRFEERMERLSRPCEPNDQEVQATDMIDLPVERMNSPTAPQATPEALAVIRKAAENKQICYAMVIKHPIHAFLSYIKAWPAKRNSENLMPGWNTFYCEWLDFLGDLEGTRWTSMRFRSLVLHPEHMLCAIAGELGISGNRLFRPGQVILPKGCLDRACRETAQAFDFDYTLQERYLEEIILTEQQRIRKAVSSRIMTCFDYRWESQDADL